MAPQKQIFPHVIPTGGDNAQSRGKPSIVEKLERMGYLVAGISLLSAQHSCTTFL
jgi:hypothetical protein